MSDAALTAGAAVLSALIGLLNTYLAHRHEKSNAETRVKVDQLVQQTNGITEQLGKAEFARGLKQGEENPL
jgi:hypothetical protein